MHHKKHRPRVPASYSSRLAPAGVEGLEPRAYLAAPAFSPKADYAAGSGATGVAVGDFNGDGRPDLVVANSTGNTLSVLLNVGGGAFGPKTDYAVGAAPFAVAVGDFNGDGKPDLATANAGIDTVSVFLNAGDGTFGAATDFAVGSSPQGLVVGDFNGDGRLDLATADFTGAAVSVLLNAGGGSFGAAANYPTGTGPIRLAAGDFNGDGKPDLVTADLNGGTVSMLFNAGNGTFGAATADAVGGSPQGLAVGDFNGDGKPDVAVADTSSNLVGVSLNAGNGTLFPQMTYSIGTSPGELAVGDFNGDGLSDIAASGAGSDSVVVLTNAGGGAFANPAAFATGVGPAGVAAGDFNGDGAPDLAAADGSADSVSVLLNAAAAQPTPPVVTTPDPTFGTGGAVTTPFASSDVTAQPDGKALVAGSAKSAKGNYTNFTLARYTAAGALDFAAAADFGAAAKATGVFAQADGKIMLAGLVTVGGKGRLALARFTAAGVLDTSFGSKGRALGPAGSVSVSSNFTVALQADGKVLVADRAASAFALSRYVVGAGGVLALDPAFGGAGTVATAFPGGRSAAARLAVQGDGRIIAAGIQGANVAVARYNPDGSLDSSFGSGGLATTPVAGLKNVSDVRVGADGTITVLGYLPPLTSKSTGVRPVLVRYTAAGALDATFGAGGTLTGSLVLRPAAVNAAFLCLAFDGRLFELDNFTVLKRLVGQADVTPPVAAVSRHLPPPTAGARTYPFSVSYNDNRGLDAASFGAGDVTVTGPGQFAGACKLLSIASGKGNGKIVTYYVNAPGGRWDAADDGTYSIVLNRRQVRDAAGNYAPAQTLGSFAVGIRGAIRVAAQAATPAVPPAGASFISAIAPDGYGFWKESPEDEPMEWSE